VVGSESARRGLFAKGRGAIRDGGSNRGRVVRRKVVPVSRGVHVPSATSRRSVRSLPSRVLIPIQGRSSTGGDTERFQGV